MNDLLIKKIDDYCGYVNRAVKYFKEEAYSDSAINCRKAAEVACKVIVYYAYPQRLADTKLNGKSLKELIVLLIHEGLTERKAINTLETLQIIGNKAAHDNPIGKDEAVYAINALNLFNEYLFVEYLKTRIPKSLDFNLGGSSEGKPIQKEIIKEKIVVQEKFNKETEEQLFSKISDIEKKAQDDDSKLEELKKELQESRQKIDELARSKQDVGPQTRKRKFPKRGIVIAALALVGLVTLTFLLKSNTPEKEAPTIYIPAKHPDTLYVAINKFEELQDNPNVNFKIEELIYTRLANFKRNFNLPVSLIYTHYKGNNVKMDTVLIYEAGRAGFDIIYFGNLYETALADSNQLEINGSYTRKEGMTIRSKKISFKSLNDSTVIKELNDQCNIPVLAYAEFHIADKPNKPLLRMVQALSYYSLEQYSYISNIKISLKTNLGDIKEAMTDVNELLSRVPANAVNLASKAYLFGMQNNFDSARIYYDASLKLDSSIFQILNNYAMLCISNKFNDKADILLKKSLSINPKDFGVYFWLAQLRSNQQDFKQAKSYALRANAISHKEPANSIILANLYGFIERNRDSAEYFYGQALGKDSLNLDALNALASYYQRFFAQEPAYREKIKYLLAKAKSLKVQNDTRTEYGFAIAAYDDNDYKTALVHFEKIYAQGSFDIALLADMSQAYYFTGQNQKALEFGKKAFNLDTNSFSNICGYACLLANTEQDYKKVSYYFNKALQIDPGSLAMYQQYGSYLSKLNRVEDCIRLGEKGYKYYPNDITINSLLAYGYLDRKEYRKAKKCFEFLETQLPYNDTLKGDYAYCILQDPRSTDADIAFGASLIKKAVEINPAYATHYLVLAMYLLNVKKTELAINNYVKAKGLSKNAIYNEELEKLCYKKIMAGKNMK